MLGAERHQQIESLFQEALDLPPAQRAGFLDAQCGADRELRAAVEDLLTHYAAADEAFLQRPTHVSGLSAAAEQLPQRIGRYRIIRKIAAGGMGVVYEARQEHPQRTVALKVIRPGLWSSSLLKRFEREAEALALLQHPGIAHIYEAGVADVEGSGLRVQGSVGAVSDHDPGVRGAQIPFFAMEFIRGEALTEYADRRRLGTRQRLELVAKVCDAVQHAHQHGIIHRDLKPANILVIEEGKAFRGQGSESGSLLNPEPRTLNPQPKVLDFGVARIIGADLQTLTLQTDVGQLIGTIPYMSPEQIGGDARAVDARADTYALGVILYELLAGRLPFDVKNRTIPEAARIIREDEPSRLSAINPIFRGDIETIANKALEKDRLRRYASAAELAADIRRYLRDEPIAARPASRLYRARKFTRRHPALVGGVLSTLVVFAGGAVVATGFAVRADRQRRIADRLAYRANIAAAHAALGIGDADHARRGLAATPLPMRGWEWSYLDWLSNPSLLTIRGGIEEFKILAFSKDTRRLFCGGADGRIQVRQADDGALLSTIEGHSRPVASLVVSPDDRLLLSSDEHELKMWDLAAGALLWRLPRPGAVSPDAFSPDGALVAAPRALEQRIVLLDARTGAEVRSLSVAGTGMCSAGFSPDGTHLLCELNLRTLLLDARSGALLWKADAWPGRYFPDGARVALWEGWWGPVRICDSASGKFLTRIADASRQIVWTISQDGTSLITQDSKGKTVIYDAADGEPFAQISAPAPAPKSNITAESDRFATTGADGTAKIWSTCTSAAPLVVRAVRDTFGGTVAADGSFSITVGWGDVVRYDTDTGAARWSTVVTRGSLEIAALSPDGKRVVVCGQDRRIRVLDTENGRLLYASSATSAPIHALAWSPDRQQLFAGGDDQSVQVLNADRGESLRILGSHASPVRAIAVSPDGSLIASGSGAVRNSAGTPAADHTVRIWETATGKPLHTLAGHTAAVNCIAFDPAGQRLLTGSDDQNVILWSIHGMRLATFSGAGASVRDVRFGPADVPERARVAAALEDGTLHIWNAGTGEELLVLRAPNGLYSAAFSSRPGPSAALIANGTNLALVAFETAPPECGWAVRRDVLRACKIVDRLFTEWQISDDVLEHLNTDSQIPDSIHPICIELVRARGDNVNRLNSETWGIAAEPSMSPEKYQTALRVAQHICRLWPEEYAFLNTRGVAEYRAGNYTDAIITLERCDAMHRAAHGTSHPVDLAVMAMAHQRLGNPDPARATLARARDALNGAAADRDALAFVHEAATLIEPP